MSPAAGEADYCDLVRDFHELLQQEYDLRIASEDAADDQAGEAIEAEYDELEEVVVDYAVEFSEIAPIRDRHLWRWMAGVLTGVGQGSDERLEAIRSRVWEVCGFDLFAFVGPDGEEVDAVGDADAPLPGAETGPTLVTPEAVQDEIAEQFGGTCSTEIEQILCGAFNDVQEYWADQYPASFGGQYEVTDMVWFSGATDTGCGQASSQTGPFYCPADHLVYFDLDFLEQLQREFGAQGDLATAYIVAHEVGHHVQTLNGTNQQVQSSSGEQQRLLGIALELQADCLAGTWVYDADRRRNEAGENRIDQKALNEALRAAATVGDDRIQEQTTGRVDPERWTHGSAEQRESWFQRGYRTGDPTQCDTFALL